MIPALVSRWLVVACVPLVFSALGAPASASLLPDQHAFLEAAKEQIPLDPKFASWMDEHSRTLTLTRGREQEFFKQLKKEDEITRQFAYLTAARSYLTRNEVASKVEALVAALSQYNRDNGEDHELSPYVFELALRLSKATIVAGTDLTRELAKETGPISCPNFRYIHERLTDASFVREAPAEVNGLLARLAKSHSSAALRESLRVFAGLVPEAKRPLYRERLHALAVRLPRFTSFVPWVVPPGAAKAVQEQAAADLGHAKLVGVQLKCRSGQCAEAHQALTAALQQKPQVLQFDSAVAAVRRVGDCFRRQGAVHRLTAWKGLVEPMEKAFGLQGWAALKLEIARFAWTADEFAEAQEVLEEVVARTSKSSGGDPSAHAQALFLWARIHENEGKFDEAIARYRNFIELFPKHENYFAAKSAMVLTYAGQRKWPQTLEMAKSIVVDESELPYDDRDVATLGFALFWGGRAAVELGHREEGLSYWQRAAAEFFSTYYGALAHYMLERVSGKYYVLRPGKTVNFKPQNLHAAFKGHDDEARFRRILALLRLGMKDEARCESRELVIESLNPPQQLGAALVQHIVGDWLAAIRTYSNMPRSYRRTLPAGVERILFPKKFDKEVADYAKRLQMDPDLIFSLIRQESVFNPRAQSGAGAMGLMQLLASTARIEAKRLGKDYVSAQEKVELVRKTKEPANLFEADTNIILGIHYLNGLMGRFDSTILSLSAYNAGPGATQRWLKKYQTDDPLYFIELIPYRETRDYVKLILRNYFYYNRWYDKSDAELPYLSDLTQFASSVRKAAASGPL